MVGNYEGPNTPEARPCNSLESAAFVNRATSNELGISRDRKGIAAISAGLTRRAVRLSHQIRNDQHQGPQTQTNAPSFTGAPLVLLPFYLSKWLPCRDKMDQGLLKVVN